MNSSTAIAALLAATPRWTAAAAWNELRKRDPGVDADFRYSSFPEDLSLAAADLHDSDFTGACLLNMNLRCAQLRNGKFVKADLRGADLSAADLSNADLSAADLRGADLRGAILTDVNFGSAGLDNHALQIRSGYRSLPLDGCDLSGAELRGVNLERANLAQIRLNSAVLVQAKLSGVTLAAAQMRGADLSGANLQGADLSNAGCENIRLIGSDLRGANLVGTCLSAADLEDARLDGAIMGWTNLSGARLAFSREIDRVTHLGPSVIDMDALVRCFRESTDSTTSKMRAGTTAMTTFIRGIGVPENVLDIARQKSFSHSHATCFISYCSTDLLFVQRLHSDLQDEGVRCWYAPEAIRAGDEIRVRIEEAIRQHARVLVVLSEASKQSEWVKFEVRAALKEEKRQRSAKTLVPIAIDGVTDSPMPDWVKTIRNTRSVGDFRGWNDSSRYRTALRWLLEALLVT